MGIGTKVGPLQIAPLVNDIKPLCLEQQIQFLWEVDAHVDVTEFGRLRQWQADVARDAAGLRNGAVSEKSRATPMQKSDSVDFSGYIRS